MIDFDSVELNPDLLSNSLFYSCDVFVFDGSVEDFVNTYGGTITYQGGTFPDRVCLKKQDDSGDLGLCTWSFCDCSEQRSLKVRYRPNTVDLGLGGQEQSAFLYFEFQLQHPTESNPGGCYWSLDVSLRTGCDCSGQVQQASTLCPCDDPDPAPGEVLCPCTIISPVKVFTASGRFSDDSSANNCIGDTFTVSNSLTDYGTYADAPPCQEVGGDYGFNVNGGANGTATIGGDDNPPLDDLPTGDSTGEVSSSVERCPTPEPCTGQCPDDCTGCCEFFKIDTFTCQGRLNIFLKRVGGTDSSACTYEFWKPDSKPSSEDGGFTPGSDWISYWSARCRSGDANATFPLGSWEITIVIPCYVSYSPDSPCTINYVNADRAGCFGCLPTGDYQAIYPDVDPENAGTCIRYDISDSLTVTCINGDPSSGGEEELERVKASYAKHKALQTAMKFNPPPAPPKKCGGCTRKKLRKVPS